MILFTTLYIQVALELLFKFQCHLYVITAEEEQKLWDYKVFVIDELKGLQRVVFFYIGKRFCIRGGKEQHSLGPSQFIRSVKPDCFMYVEHNSKNYTGRAKDLK